MRRGDSGDVIAAALNAPLVVTDRLLTGPQSRAELQFDWANMLRMGSNAEVRLSELENHRYQIQIALGTTTFRVLRNSNADVEISTPTVSIRPLRRGVYRVTVQEDGATEITVRNGEADIFTPRGSERLRVGRTLFARGTPADPEVQVASPLSIDDWDRWNESRDRDLERSTSYQYVSPDISGAEDLEGHGRWVSVEGYGTVWSPAVDPGWAPYRYGRWTWIDYYGWTWVSYDPWGWAPYHYGRWLHAPGFGWCWWPGGIRERNYWRPALVAFFGFGGRGALGSDIGFGFANVGWVPLAPREPFHPWYGRGLYGGYRNTTIVQNTTIINNTNISTVYRNARSANGITAVNSDVFGRRNIGNRDFVRVAGSDIQGAGLVRGVLPVTPGHESLRLSDRSIAASAVPRMADSRSFVSRRAPVSVNRIPFEQQRQAIERIAQRTFGNGVASWGARSGPAVNQTPSVNNGWRRIEPAPGIAPNVRSAPAPEQGSWHRFGDTAPHANEAPVSGSGRFNGVSQAPAAADRSYRAPARTVPAARDERAAQPTSQDRNYDPPGFGTPGSDGLRTNYAAPSRTEAPARSYQPQAVHISPPLVRERPVSQPSEARGGGRGGNSPPAARGNSGGGESSRPSSSTGSHDSGGRSRGR